MGFKERLREEIEYRGLLIKEVSAALGISNSTFLSYIDARGVLPNVETAVNIADYLGVSVEYLVNGTEAKNQKESAESTELSKLVSAYKKLSPKNRTMLLKFAVIMSD